MSTPANKADAQENEASEASFADVVNDVVNKATVDAKGNLVLPDDTTEEVRFAATLEKRRRDTQVSHTKLSQKNKALEAEKAELLKQATGSVTLELTTEQAEELEELKFSDPEAWRNKVNTLEKDARTKRVKEIDETLKQVSSSTLDKDEVERRKSVLAKFLEDNKDFEIDDDVIANDIPPRITKKLEKGDISFEEFLQECLDYTKTGKVVKQTEETPGNVDLGKVGGGDRPDKNAVKEDIIISYRKETY